jgi:hypothetical protein
MITETSAGVCPGLPRSPRLLRADGGNGAPFGSPFWGPKRFLRVLASFPLGALFSTGELNVSLESRSIVRP